MNFEIVDWPLFGYRMPPNPPYKKILAICFLTFSLVCYILFLNYLFVRWLVLDLTISEILETPIIHDEAHQRNDVDEQTIEPRCM